MSQPELTPGQRRVAMLAKVFDLRNFIGSLFVVFGVIVTLYGLFGVHRSEIDKAAGLNVSLWTGVVMLVVGLGFIAWTFLAPPEILHGHEISEDDLPEQLRHHGLEAIPEHLDHRPGTEPPPR